MTAKNIHEAIGNAQKKIGVLTKEADNPYFDSKYVDHASLVETINPVLAEEDIVLTTAVQVIPTATGIASVVEVHMELVGDKYDDLPDEERRFISRYPLPNTDNPQKFAAATTYARRYAPICVLNLPCVDDDGNFSSGKAKTHAGVGIGAAAALQALKGR